MIAGINNVNNSSQGFSVFRNSVTLKKSAIAGLREEDTRAMAKFGPSLVKLIVRFNVSANTLRLGKTMLCIIRSKEFTKTKKYRASENSRLSVLHFSSHTGNLNRYQEKNVPI
jgi:hypothetical protein